VSPAIDHVTRDCRRELCELGGRPPRLAEASAAHGERGARQARRMAANDALLAANTTLLLLTLVLVTQLLPATPAVRRRETPRSLVPLDADGVAADMGARRRRPNSFDEPSLAHIVVNDRSMPRRRRNATAFTAPKGRYEAILNSSIRVRGGGRGGGGRHRAAAAPQRRNFTRRAPGVPLEQSFGGYLEPPRKKANASAPRPRRAGAARRMQKANASAPRPAPRKPANRTIRTVVR
jgi:hypothetical protein